MKDNFSLKKKKKEKSSTAKVRIFGGKKKKKRKSAITHANVSSKVLCKWLTEEEGKKEHKYQYEIHNPQLFIYLLCK